MCARAEKKQEKVEFSPSERFAPTVRTRKWSNDLEYAGTYVTFDFTLEPCTSSLLSIPGREED